MSRSLERIKENFQKYLNDYDLINIFSLFGYLARKQFSFHANTYDTIFLVLSLSNGIAYNMSYV